ncbi:alanine/glycine:cation symporter family protein [Shewanella surugensis]|uniref:Alanine:cation symporter family protein n=1 Tax=Shewanella surugensis TaxID=212020 RepID=A0ABT0LAZ6_9GAMM|nr:alanine/glycine:cation symporter family protein [Shewanella surugensis]MCL1124527.1 alanine:cation symporter family protein [Shewanella surugensis]
MQILDTILQMLLTLVWDYFLIYILLIIGVYFTIKIRFSQFTHLKHMLSLLMEHTGTKEESKKRISSFGAFAVTSASRVGSGNIAGVGVAIYLGGPGAVFWMWIIALIGTASCLIENTLAQAYKNNTQEGSFRGGPAFYIAQGLKSKKLALLFSVLMIISYGLVFNSVQANTIAHAMNTAFSVSNLNIAIDLAIFTLLIIFGGLKRVVKASEVLFPLMAILYLLTALIIVVMNISEVIPVFSLIIGEALGLKEATTGAFGVMVMQGIKRGLFSNEAGMGSTPNAGAAAYVSHPVKQGYIQSLGVLVDTLLISSATAFIILLPQINLPASGTTGVASVHLSMNMVFGEFGGYCLAILVMIFSYSSILGNYFYGEMNIKYMTDSKWILNGFRCAVIVMLLYGSLAAIGFVWDLADLFMGLLALVNISAIFLLRHVALALVKDYMQQLAKGKDPIFHRNSIPELEDVECWGDAEYRVFQRELKCRENNKKLDT